MFEIGTSLREARLRQAVDFPEAERATKIRAKYLRALEEEQFEQLPAQPYVKGFLRTYAEFLGLDGQLYVDEYNSRYVVGEEEVPLRPRRSNVRIRRDARAERRVVLVALVAIAAVTASLIAAWTIPDGGQGENAIPNLGTADARGRPAKKPTSIVFRARGGTSSLTILAGSPTGNRVWNGTLEPGKPVAFRVKGTMVQIAVAPYRTKRLWAQVATPENVQVTVLGKKLPLRAGRPVAVLVSRYGIRPAGA